MIAFGRWLLQLDRPGARTRSEDEIVAEVERNYTWNFTVNLLDGVWFMIGASFITSSTILPLFLSKLTTNPLWFGLLAVIAQAGWFLPQLFTANLMERLARKKPVVVNAGFFLERVPIWVIFAAAWPRTAARRWRWRWCWPATPGTRLGAGDRCGLMAGSDRALLPDQPARALLRHHVFPGRGDGRGGRGAQQLAAKTLPFPHELRATVSPAPRSGSRSVGSGWR